MVCAEAPVALTDSELFCRYRDLDDQDAFNALYARYSGLHAFIKRKFRFDDSTADDAVQQTWLNVTRYRHCDVKKFRSWLVRIAQNAACRIHNELTRSVVDDECDEYAAVKSQVFISINELDELTEPVDHRVKPIETRAVTSELFAAIDKLISTLPPPMSRAIHLVANGSHILPAAKESGVHATSLCRTLAELRPFIQ